MFVSEWPVAAGEKCIVGRRADMQCLPAWNAALRRPDSSLTLNAITTRPLSIGFAGLGVMGRADGVAPGRAPATG